MAKQPGAREWSQWSRQSDYKSTGVVGQHKAPRHGSSLVRVFLDRPELGRAVVCSKADVNSGYPGHWPDYGAGCCPGETGTTLRRSMARMGCQGWWVSGENTCAGGVSSIPTRVFCSGETRPFHERSLVLQRRHPQHGFLDLARFWAEIASQNARAQSCQACGLIAMRMCSRVLSCQPSL